MYNILFSGYDFAIELINSVKPEHLTELVI